MIIETNLFPIPEGGYTASQGFESFLPMSILALHLQILESPLSLIPNERPKGHFFFRDYGVPLPRPCTIPAWTALCRLGKPNSPEFVLPFLPSLRIEDEIGSAITERGIKLPSLSRRSNLHEKNDENLIMWGPVYIGAHGSLIAAIPRSNFNESQVTTRLYQDPRLAQNSIRSRMEFLASHGFVSTYRLSAELAIPAIARVLFQFLSQKAAESWFKVFDAHLQTCRQDLGQIQADYKDLIQEMIQARQVKPSDESSEGKAKQKFSINAANLDDFF